MDAVDSVFAAQLRAFVDNLDRRWHWWNSHRDQRVPAVVPDDRGLIYLPNYHEDYVVAVTPLDHDMVYVAEITSPIKAVSGVLAGRDVVLVLADNRQLHVLSPSLAHLQSIDLHDPASDLIWADDLLWVCGPERNHIELFDVYTNTVDELVFRPFRSVDQVPGVQHVLWLPAARTVAAVAGDTLHFIGADDLLVETVPLPTTVQHAAAHNALLVFAETGTGEALALDLAASTVFPLHTDTIRTMGQDPVITSKLGFHEPWHGHYKVSLVTVAEPGSDDVNAVVQSIEQINGPANLEQPETVVHVQEKTDFFRLPTIKDCLAGDHYDSDPFVLSGDGDPLLVLSEGCAMVLPPLDGSEQEREVFAAWITDEDVRLRRQYNSTDGLHARSRVRVYEPVNEELTLGDMELGELTGTDVQADSNGSVRLFLYDPTPGNGFWVGQFTSIVYPVSKLTMLEELTHVGRSIVPQGTSVTTEVRVRYRRENQVTPEYTEWSATIPEAPEDATVIGVQARLYLLTNDPAITPEVHGLKLVHTRHELLTTGFWDLHRTKAVGGRLMHALSGAGSGHTAERASKDQGGLQSTTSRLERGFKAASLQRSRYGLGSRLNVRWHETQYELHRISAQYEIGRASFRASPSLPFNSWRIDQYRLHRAHMAGSQRVDARLQQRSDWTGPSIRTVGLFNARGHSNDLTPAGAYRDNSLQFTGHFDYARRSDLGQLMTSTGVYGHQYTLGDTKYFLGLRALAARLDREVRNFSLHQHTMTLNHGTRFGANYQSVLENREATTFIAAADGAMNPADPLRPTTYHIPLKGVQALAANGEYKRRGILGVDVDNYTVDEPTVELGYRALTALLTETHSEHQDVGSVGDYSRSGTPVREVLTATGAGPAPYRVGQLISSWRSRSPLRKTAHSSRYARDVFAVADDVDRWLSSMVKDRRTLVGEKLSALGLSQLTGQLSRRLNARRFAGFHASIGDTVRLRALRRTDMGLDPMAAYPVQSYQGSVGDKIGYRFTPGFGAGDRTQKVSVFGEYSQTAKAGQVLDYVMTHGNRIHELRQSIRFALDWLAISHGHKLLYDGQAGSAASLADAVTLHRASIQRSGTGNAEASVSNKLGADADAMTPGTQAHSWGRVDTLSGQAKGHAGSRVDPISYAFNGVTTPFSDLVYQSLSDWAGETPTDRQRFIRAVLNAESAGDVRALKSYLNTASSALVKSALAGHSAPQADLIRFMAAAYLTGNLPGANVFDIRSGSSMAGLVDLLYKTFADSAYSEDYFAGTDTLNAAVNRITLQALTARASAHQDALFDVLKGIGSHGTQTAVYRQYQWQNRVGDRVSILPGTVSASNLQFGGQMAPTVVRSSSGFDTVRLKLFTGIKLAPGRLIRYRPQAGTRAQQARSLEARIHRWTSTAPNPIKGLLASVPTVTADPFYGQIVGLTSGQGDAYLKSFRGASVSRQRITLTQLAGQHGEIRQAVFTLTKGHSGGGFVDALARASWGTQVPVDAASWHYGADGTAWAGARLKRFEPVSGASVTATWNVVSSHHGYGPQQVTVLRWDGLGSAQNKARFDVSSLAPSVGRGATARPQRFTRKWAGMTLDVSRSVGLRSPVMPAAHQQLTYGRQTVRLNNTGRATSNELTANALAGGWQSRLKSRMVQWAYAQFRAISTKLDMTRFHEHAQDSELVDFRFDRVGMTMGELVDMTAVGSFNSFNQTSLFEGSSSHYVTNQARFVLTGQNAVNQTIRLEGLSGATALQKGMSADAGLGSMRYWADQMEGRAHGSSSVYEKNAVAVHGPATPAQLLRAEYTRQTLQNAVRARMNGTLWYTSVASQLNTPFLKQSGQQVTFAKGAGYEIFGTDAIDVAMEARKASVLTGTMNRARYQRMAADSIRLGGRIWAVTGQALHRELAIGFNDHSGLTTAEKMVLLHTTLSSALMQALEASTGNGQSVADLNTVAVKLHSEARDALGKAPKFRVTAAQRQELVDVIVRAKEAASTVGVRVEVVPQGLAKVAMASVETIVMKWTDEIVEAFGGTEKPRTLEAAIDMIKQLPLSGADVATTSKVFGQDMTLADVAMQVMQPLVRLQTVLGTAMSALPSLTQVGIGWRFEKGLQPLPVGAAMTKYHALSLTEAAAKLSKAASVGTKQVPVAMTITATMRTAKLALLNGQIMQDRQIGIQAGSTRMASSGLVPMKAEFHVRGGLDLPGGGKLPLLDVTMKADYKPWKFSKSFHLQTIETTKAALRAELQNIEMEVQSSRSVTLSEKARYWFPKFRFVFPEGLPNYLQDYGFLSPGLEGGVSMEYRQEDLSGTLLKSGTQTRENSTVSAVSQGRDWSGERPAVATGTRSANSWGQDESTATGMAFTTMRWQQTGAHGSEIDAPVATQERLVALVHQTRYQLANINGFAASNTVDRVVLGQRVSASATRVLDVVRPQLSMVFTGYDLILAQSAAPVIARAWHTPDTDMTAPAAWVGLVKERFDAASHTVTDLLKWSTTDVSTTATAVQGLKGPSVGMTHRFDYSLAIDPEVQLGKSVRIDDLTLSRTLAADFRVTARRLEPGFDLIATRTIGLKDASVTVMPVRVDDWNRINPQTVANYANEISTVLRDAMIRVSDKLDYERLLPDSEARVFHHYVGDLTNWVLQNWDYRQNRVTIGEKAHDEVIRILKQDWFGKAWHAQAADSLSDFGYQFTQKLLTVSESFGQYRQQLDSDSTLMNALVQAESVTSQFYMALTQTGMNHSQVEFVLRQTRSALADAYYQLRQFRGQGHVDGTRYEQALTSDQLLDRLYQQLDDSAQSLHRALVQAGFSEAQIRHVYEQTEGFDRARLMISSKYVTYRDMVVAAGAAFEQYLMSDTGAMMHYRMHRPMDTVEQARYAGQINTTPDVIDLYKQGGRGVAASLNGEYTVDMATVLDSIDYSIMKPLPFHDRVDVNLPITFRSEDFRRYKAGIVAIDLMQWLRDLRTEYREELIAKIHAGEAKGSYSPRAAMMEAIRNGIVEPVLYRDPKDGSWLYRKFTVADTEYNYIVWGCL